MCMQYQGKIIVHMTSRRTTIVDNVHKTKLLYIGNMKPLPTMEDENANDKIQKHIKIPLWKYLAFETKQEQSVPLEYKEGLEYDQWPTIWKSIADYYLNNNGNETKVRKDLIYLQEDARFDALMKSMTLYKTMYKQINTSFAHSTASPDISKNFAKELVLLNETDNSFIQKDDVQHGLNHC